MRRRWRRVNTSRVCSPFSRMACQPSLYDFQHVTFIFLSQLLFTRSFRQAQHERNLTEFSPSRSPELVEGEQLFSIKTPYTSLA
jgi:hypothetical protein